MKTSKNHSCRGRYQDLGKNMAMSRKCDSGPLTKSEEELLTGYEHILTRGLATFFEVGNALMAIRDNHLYRCGYASFEEYCNERWGIGRTYAWRVIGAAERLRLLPVDDTPRPSSEFQMRPFLKLQPEAFPSAWKRVLEQTQNRPITSALIGGLVHEFGSSCTDAHRKPEAKRGKALPKARIGEILMLLERIRRYIDCEQGDNAKADLERIERLILLR
jgi:hypothetical protein